MSGFAVAPRCRPQPCHLSALTDASLLKLAHTGGKSRSARQSRWARVPLWVIRVPPRQHASNRNLLTDASSCRSTKQAGRQISVPFGHFVRIAESCLLKDTHRYYKIHVDSIGGLPERSIRGPVLGAGFWDVQPISRPVQSLL